MNKRKKGFSLSILILLAAIGVSFVSPLVVETQALTYLPVIFSTSPGYNAVVELYNKDKDKNLEHVDITALYNDRSQTEICKKGEKLDGLNFYRWLAVNGEETSLKIKESSQSLNFFRGKAQKLFLDNQSTKVDSKTLLAFVGKDDINGAAINSLLLNPTIKNLEYKREDKDLYLKGEPDIDLNKIVAFPSPGYFPKKHLKSFWTLVLPGNMYSVQNRANVKAFVNGDSRTTKVAINDKIKHPRSTVSISFAVPSNNKNGKFNIVIRGVSKKSDDGSHKPIILTYRTVVYDCGKADPNAEKVAPMERKDLEKKPGGSTDKNDTGSSDNNSGTSSNKPLQNESNAVNDPADEGKYDYDGDISFLGGNFDAISPFDDGGPLALDQLLNYAVRLANGFEEDGDKSSNQNSAE